MEVVDQIRQLGEAFVLGQHPAVVMQFLALLDKDKKAAKKRVGRTAMTLKIS